jgi:hypothetical protein
MAGFLSLDELFEGHWSGRLVVRLPDRPRIRSPAGANNDASAGTEEFFAEVP